MSTIVCQNLVPCFESPLAETTTTLKLKFAAPPPPAAVGLYRNLRADDHSPRNEFSSWGFFLQTHSKESEDPLPKYSPFSKLSPKSLELCTENLGSESGSDTVSDCSSIFSASPPLSPTSDSDDGRRRAVFDHPNHGKEACRKIKNFPPPLTTMTGSSALQVRRRREGGRLIIEAVEGPFRNSYLQAERSDGRLKLCFTSASCGEEREEEEEEENVDGNGGGGGGGAEEEEIEEPRNEYESEMGEFDGEINVMEKFQRLSRCKEGGHGNKGLCNNWKPALWVATS